MEKFKFLYDSKRSKHQFAGSRVTLLFLNKVLSGGKIVLNGKCTKCLVNKI